LVLIGLLAYCAGLIAMIPASLILPQSDWLKTGGTAWNGEAVLGSAMRIEWHWAPIETLTRCAFTAGWRMTGAQTDLVGLVIPGRHSMRLLDVTGQADGTLLASAAPDLPFTCRFLAQIDLRDVAIGGADQRARGTLRSSPVSCTAQAMPGASVDMPALDLPAMHAAIGADRTGMGSSGTLVTASGAQPMAELRLARGGALSLWPAPALVARAPLLAQKRLDTTLIW
jgi:hypothetical protein